jgi:hypothetical protein
MFKVTIILVQFNWQPKAHACDTAFILHKAVCLFCFVTASGRLFPSYLRACQWSMCIVHSYTSRIDLPRYNFCVSFMPYTLSSSLFRPKIFYPRTKSCFLREGLGRNTRDLNQGSCNSKLGYLRHKTAVVSAFCTVVTVLGQLCTESFVRHLTRNNAWALHKKVKQSLFAPVQAQRVPGGRGSQVLRQSPNEDGKVVTTHAPAAFTPPENIPGISFC